MTEGAAIEIIRYQMCELGVIDYIVRYRHLRLKESEKRIIKAENHLFVLIDPQANIKVESKAGIYDMRDQTINEQQHLHRGIISVTNQSLVQNDARFIQAIPRQKKKQKS
ncbi:MAG: hypothetical protein HYZ14_03070 [Bacteroidetes bacterium]|nr:hypothetical protein [Bacteroidota bacterium]